MDIEELSKYDAQDRLDMDGLMHELSPRSSCSEETLRTAAEDPGCHIFVIRSAGHIVASGCLCVAHSTEGCIGFVESVCVSASMRGQGLGRLIMEKIMAEARRMGVRSLHLTSHPSRVAANRLYQSLGFELRDTNAYRMAL